MYKRVSIRVPLFCHFLENGTLRKKLKTSEISAWCTCLWDNLAKTLRRQVHLRDTEYR